MVNPVYSGLILYWHLPSPVTPVEPDKLGQGIDANKAPKSVEGNLRKRLGGNISQAVGRRDIVETGHIILDLLAQEVLIYGSTPYQEAIAFWYRW
jgi:hypothetical protein